MKRWNNQNKFYYCICKFYLRRCFGETLSTLNFARRAKMIKNKAVINEDVTGNVPELQAEIKKLKELLSQARGKGLFRPQDFCKILTFKTSLLLFKLSNSVDAVDFVGVVTTSEPHPLLFSELSPLTITTWLMCHCSWVGPSARITVSVKQNHNGTEKSKHHNKKYLLLCLTLFLHCACGVKSVKL